ncbi:hypothetical protein [Bacillus sp. AG4(2022)]|uniref:hypothetical protein n=1 Tax=Bacillus sp. AG4(2022) TaxID=2962594 RepID=UPI002882166C|nr:hypothetical protein [Bacillus sp. AG4(2022)]MDT0160409.1 hypothetical protein [Bacillus sp. AG4(2022)]
MKQFNLNQSVKFKLTEYGEQVLTSHWRGKYLTPEEDGFYSMQAWTFVNTFKDYINLGVRPVIEGADIYFEDKDLKDYEA